MNLKKNINIFIILIVITFIIFIPFLNKHYATDTYNIASIGYKEYAIRYSFNDGRIIMGLICLFADVLNVNIDIFVLVLTALALVTTCFTVIVLKNIILTIKQTDKLSVKILLLLICYFTIFNFLYIENMLFVECFVMSISILMYILAAFLLVNKRKVFLASICLFIGIICYQGTISMYLIMLLFFSILENEKIKSIVIDPIIGSFLAGCFVILQLMLIKLHGAIFNLTQERLNGISGIWRNIIITFKYTPMVLTYTGFVYTKYLYLLFILALSIISFIKIKIEKKNSKLIINLLLIVLFSILFAMSISFMSTSAFVSARVRYSIGASIGIVFLYLYCKTDMDLKRIYNILLLIILVTYVFTIVFNYVCIMNNHLKVNFEDKKMAQEVIKYVEQYEEINNLKVDKIALFVGQLKSKAYYEGLKYKGSVLSWSAIRTKWAIKGVLEMYSNKKFEKINVEPDMLKEYMNNVDVEKDYMCVNNTLYIPYYVY